MGKHSIVETKNNLSELVSQAERGEEVVITRHGRPVAVIKAFDEAAVAQKRVTAADIQWLRARRIKMPPGTPDSATMVRRMRDEGY